ncbi:MAG: SDR family NAD(P)-dependent oxidoreductase [Bradymonadaceae bacterium]
MDGFDGRVVAITGAAGGIGTALAKECADRGAGLAISDIDEEGLEETADAVRSRGAEVRADVVDVSDREAVREWAEEVESSFGGVHYIVNNAGVSATASVEGMSYEDFEWLMSINFWGVVHGTKAFLPRIRRSGGGRVVNVSSIFGVVAPATQSAYASAKFAVRGFTESLRAELALDEGEVGATCVHPGGVATGIVRDSRIGDTGPAERSRDEVVEEFEEELASLSPEETAAEIADGVEAGKGRILVGTDAKMLDTVQRLFSGSYPEPLAYVSQLKWELSRDDS